MIMITSTSTMIMPTSVSHHDDDVSFHHDHDHDDVMMTSVIHLADVSLSVVPHPLHVVVHVKVLLEINKTKKRVCLFKISISNVSISNRKKIKGAIARFQGTPNYILRKEQSSSRKQRGKGSFFSRSTTVQDWCDRTTELRQKNSVHGRKKCKFGHGVQGKHGGYKKHTVIPTRTRSYRKPGENSENFPPNRNS